MRPILAVAIAATLLLASSATGATTTDYVARSFNQPAAVVSSLAAGNWCNPPGAGLGLRPTAKTGVPLLELSEAEPPCGRRLRLACGVAAKDPR